jgi:hypothetical protein
VLPYKIGRGRHTFNYSASLHAWFVQLRISNYVPSNFLPSNFLPGNYLPVFGQAPACWAEQFQSHMSDITSASMWRYAAHVVPRRM